jgi:hypothetical protein
MDSVVQNPWFDADNSMAYLQLKPARRHIEQISKRLSLAHIGSKRAHLRHTFRDCRKPVSGQARHPCDSHSNKTTMRLICKSLIHRLHSLRSLHASLSCDLLTSYPSGKIALGDLKRLGRLHTSKQVKRSRDHSSPPGLVAGPKSRTIIRMEVLIE